MFYVGSSHTLAVRSKRNKKEGRSQSDYYSSLTKLLRSLQCVWASGPKELAKRWLLNQRSPRLHVACPAGPACSLRRKYKISLISDYPASLTSRPETRPRLRTCVITTFKTSSSFFLKTSRKEVTPSQKILILYQSNWMFLWIFWCNIDSCRDLFFWKGKIECPHKS